MEARAALAAHEFKPAPTGPVEARYALNIEDMLFLRGMDAAFREGRV